MVIKKPFPTIPIKFWNDQKNKKFKNAYFTNIKIFGTMAISFKKQKMGVL